MMYIRCCCYGCTAVRIYHSVLLLYNRTAAVVHVVKAVSYFLIMYTAAVVPPGIYAYMHAVCMYV